MEPVEPRIASFFTGVIFADRSSDGNVEEQVAGLCRVDVFISGRLCFVAGEAFASRVVRLDLRTWDLLGRSERVSWLWSSP